MVMAKRRSKEIDIPTQQRFKNDAGFVTNAKPLSNPNVGLSVTFPGGEHLMDSTTFCKMRESHTQGKKR